MIFRPISLKRKRLLISSTESCVRIILSYFNWSSEPAAAGWQSFLSWTNVIYWAIIFHLTQWYSCTPLSVVSVYLDQHFQSLFSLPQFSSQKHSRAAWCSVIPGLHRWLEVYGMRQSPSRAIRSLEEAACEPVLRATETLQTAHHTHTHQHSQWCGKTQQTRCNGFLLRFKQNVFAYCQI